MESDAVPVTVHILDKEYRVACRPEERDALMSSARYLNERMKEIRDTGKVVGVDRIAVMAALNITNDLLQKDAEKDNDIQGVNDRLRSLTDRIDVILGQEEDDGSAASNT